VFTYVIDWTTVNSRGWPNPVPNASLLVAVVLRLLADDSLVTSADGIPLEYVAVVVFDQL
jgi:hypothetical protein